MFQNFVPNSHFPVLFLFDLLDVETEELSLRSAYPLRKVAEQLRLFDAEQILFRSKEPFRLSSRRYVVFHGIARCQLRIQVIYL